MVEDSPAVQTIDSRLHHGIPKAKKKIIVASAQYDGDKSQ